MMDALAQWFRKFTSREQLYLLAAAAAVTLYVLYMAIWLPLSGARDDMENRNRAVAAQLVKVRAMASELQALETSGGASRQRNVNQRINTTTNRFGIRPSRIQPNARGETQIRFEQVGFAELMRWLHQVETVEGLPVRDLAITQSDRGGLVKATIRLGPG